MNLQKTIEAILGLSLACHEKSVLLAFAFNYHQNGTPPRMGDLCLWCSLSPQQVRKAQQALKEKDLFDWVVGL